MPTQTIDPAINNQNYQTNLSETEDTPSPGLLSPKNNKHNDTKESLIPRPILDQLFLKAVIAAVFDQYAHFNLIGKYYAPYFVEDIIQVLGTNDLEECMQTLETFSNTSDIPNLIKQFQEKDMYLEQNRTARNSVRGINSPAFFTLDYDGFPLAGIYCKAIKDSQKFKKETILSDCIDYWGADIDGLSLLQTKLARTHNNIPYVYSQIEPSITIEEGLRSGVFTADHEQKFIKNLAKFNVIGTYAVAVTPGIYKEYSSKDAIEVCSELSDLTAISPAKNPTNYITELQRRMKRKGISNESAFIQYFTENYLKPIMQTRIFSHNDLHIGNAFCNGKIFDLEIAGLAAFGEDLAQYLISKYSHVSSSKKTPGIKEIIAENRQIIQQYIAQYNTEVDDLRLLRDADESMTGLKKTSYKKFLPHFEKVMMHCVLTYSLKRERGYELSDEKKNLEIAGRSFGIFYASLNAIEREMFDEEKMRSTNV